MLLAKSYDEREKKKREILEARIEEFLASPSKYNASNRYGVKKYLKLNNLDKTTGEITKIEPLLEFEKEKYQRDVVLDGYYILITSELELSEEEVISKYCGLWKIEESFRVIKSGLEGRPVYVRRNDHVEGHFLICYIALLLTRILEYNLKHEYSIKKISESLSAATVTDKKQGIFEITNKQKYIKK